MWCTAIYVYQATANFVHGWIKRKNYDYGNLPPHIIANILSRLLIDDFRNASKVCKSWYYASFDPCVIKNIVVSFGVNSIDCDHLVRPIYNASFVTVNFNNLHYRRLLRNSGDRIVDILLDSKITMTQLFELFIYLPNVCTLNIFRTSKHVSTGNFHRSKNITKYKAQIIENLSNIKSVKIYTELQNLKLYRLFLSYCSNLDTLHFCDVGDESYRDGDFLFDYLLNPTENPVLYKVTDLNLSNIQPKQSKKCFEILSKLELRNVKQLTLSEISSTYYDTKYREFCKTYNFLKHFTVKGCNEAQLTDICKYMTNLKSLTLYRCTANNLKELLNLKMLLELHIEREGVIVHDDLIVLLNSEHKLIKLNVNEIDANLLKIICECCKNIEELTLGDVHTKNCEPIFRNLLKLKRLGITFTEPTNVNSSRIISSDRYNITNLIELQHLYISSYVPGITPELIQKLPKIKRGWEYIDDPSEEELSTGGNDQYESNTMDAEEKNIVYNISDFNWYQELEL